MNEHTTPVSIATYALSCMLVFGGDVLAALNHFAPAIGAIAAIGTFVLNLRRRR